MTASWGQELRCRTRISRRLAPDARTMYNIMTVMKLIMQMHPDKHVPVLLRLVGLVDTQSLMKAKFERR